MNKTYKKLAILILSFVLLSLVGCCSKCGTITLLAPAPNAVLTQHPAEMHEFLLLPDAARKDYFNDKEKRAVLYERHQSVPNEFRWEASEPLAEARLEFALDEAFTTSAQEFVVSLDAKEQKAMVCNFLAGKNIYWRVKGTNEAGKPFASPVGVFKTEDLLPRQITLPGVDNVRDVGGWKTADGRRMRQGIIFRSAGFNLDSPDWQWDEKKRIDPMKSRIGETIVKPEGIDYLVNKVGIKTELDLRWDGEVAVMKESPLGPKVKWIHISSYDYGRLFSPEGKAARAARG